MYYLKRCPFCGGEAKFVATSNISRTYNSGYGFTIKCSKCNLKLPKEYVSVLMFHDNGDIAPGSTDDRKQAAADWNERVQEDKTIEDGE